LLKKNRIRSTEKMPNSPPCKKLNRKLRPLQRSPARSKKRRLSSKDNGTPSWPKEQSKKRRIKRPPNKPSNRKLLRRRLKERLLN